MPGFNSRSGHKDKMSESVGQNVYQTGTKCPSNGDKSSPNIRDKTIIKNSDEKSCAPKKPYLQKKNLSDGKRCDVSYDIEAAERQASQGAPVYERRQRRKVDLMK